LTKPTDEELAHLNAQNPNLRFERTLSGEIVVSPPTGLSTGPQNSDLTSQIVVWNRAHGHGKVLGSSTGVSIGLNASPTPAGLAAPSTTVSRSSNATSS
jgi:Uma2 family endonuclease